MWSEEYRERDELFSEVLKTLVDADKFGLVKYLCQRLDDWAGAKAGRFNRLCRYLIRRYGGQA